MLCCLIPAVTLLCSKLRRGKRICPKSHGWEADELRFDAPAFDVKACVPSAPPRKLLLGGPTGKVPDCAKPGVLMWEGFLASGQ